jgi:hypothetical protein
MGHALEIPANAHRQKLLCKLLCNALTPHLHRNASFCTEMEASHN